MAKSRKKKKQQPPSITRSLEVTKTYFDKYSAVARKTLQLMDLDPALYDRFTKKQKISMMKIKGDIPRVKARPGHAIPRHYIKKIQQELYDFIKIYPVNSNQEINLSYTDLLTYGICFMTYVALKASSEEEIENKETYQLIFTKIEQVLYENDNNIMMDLWQYLRYRVSSLSKINIRIYGFDWSWDINEAFRSGALITISAVSPQKIHFAYNDKYRPAYQAICGSFLTGEAIPITIPYNQIIEESDRTHLLEVYVQSHALTRMKERIDILPAAIRNLCLNSSLTHCQTATLNNGQRVLKLTENNTGIIGYLPFTIIKDKLFVLTFLPICNQNAPEGKKLQEILGIGRKETEFLGMDKLSFFIDTDFEALPRLKQAVIDSGLWHLATMEPLPDYKPQNPMSTATLARFFKTEHSHEEVLKEIEEKY